MSFADIRIVRELPIIRGHVRVPPCLEANVDAVTDATALTEVSGSDVSRMRQGSGVPTGSKTGAQEWLELPAWIVGQDAPTDPVPKLV